MAIAKAQQPPRESAPLDRICIRDGGDHLVLSIRAILFARRDDRVTTLQLDDQTVTVRLPLDKLERLLQPFGFFRSHRAFLVNLRHVRRIVPWSEDAASLLLDDPKETMIPLAKSRRQALRSLLLWP